MSTPHALHEAAKGGRFAAREQPRRFAAEIRCDVLEQVSTVKQVVRATSAGGGHEMSAMQWTDLARAPDPGLPEFFLGRLAALAARQAAAVSPAERQALGLATFSVFLDCLDLGLGEEAHANVGPLRAEAGPTARPAA